MEGSVNTETSGHDEAPVSASALVNESAENNEGDMLDQAMSELLCENQGHGETGDGIEGDAGSTLENRTSCVVTFNRTLRQFLDDLKTTFPELTDSIDERYRSIDESTEEYIQWFDQHTSPHFALLTAKNDDVFEDNDTLFLFPDINFSKLWRCNIDEKSREAMWKYMHLLLVLVSQYKQDATTIEELFQEWNALLETNNLEQDDLSAMKEHAEGMMKLMQNLTNGGNDGDDDDDSNAEAKIPSVDDLKDDPFMKKLGDSKIAQFAKELTHDINVNDLGLSGGEDISSFQDVFQIFGKNPQKVVNLVKTVGEKIQTKLTNGDIKQSELMEDAHNLMSTMQDSDVFKQMFKNVRNHGKRRKRRSKHGSSSGGGGFNPEELLQTFAEKMGVNQEELQRMSEQFMQQSVQAQTASRNHTGKATRDRLRHKLEQRQKNAASAASSTTVSDHDRPPTTTIGERVPSDGLGMGKKSQADGGGNGGGNNNKKKSRRRKKAKAPNATHADAKSDERCDLPTEACNATEA